MTSIDALRYRTVKKANYSYKASSKITVAMRIRK